MKENKHPHFALLISILILLCLLIAGGILAVSGVISLPGEKSFSTQESAEELLGVEPVLNALTAAEQARTGRETLWKGMPGGAGSAVEAPVISGDEAADTASAEKSAEKGSSGDKTGSEKAAAGSLTGKGKDGDSTKDDAKDKGKEKDSSKDREEDSALEEAKEVLLSFLPAKTGKDRLTKVQKEYIKSWEAFHGRTFPQNAPLHEYNWKYLSYDEDGILQYKGDKQYTVRHGIDVSEFQGSIDWKRVRKAGYDFAFVRAGYRMFNTGELYQDSKAVRNLKDAAKAGLDVGVYVFSQAITKKEAREEAELCLKVIRKSGVTITLPVVFDPEIQIDYVARINYISREEFTDNAVAFCERIEKAGYMPAVYANSSTETDILDMSRLNDALIWYADYNPVPESPYRFTFWQYSDYGWVDGIPETETDLNLWFIKKETGEDKSS